MFLGDMRPHGGPCSENRAKQIYTFLFFPNIAHLGKVFSAMLIHKNKCFSSVF